MCMNKKVGEKENSTFGIFIHCRTSRWVENMLKLKEFLVEFLFLDEIKLA